MSSLRLCCQITYKDKIRDINVLRANKGLKPVRKANTAGSIYARWYLVVNGNLKLTPFTLQMAK